MQSDKAMKKILVPTDFSDNAYRAAEYAARMGVEQQYNLHILHCYTATSSSFSASECDESEKESMTLKADITMKELLEKLQKEFPNLLISYSNERGLLEEVIPQEAAKKDYAVIVMGTTGSSANKNVFWGSNTAQIIAKTSIPVIAIPEDSASMKSNKIGLLTNFQAEELITLQEFMQIFNTQIDLDLIHIYGENDNLETVKDKLNAWSFNIRKFNNIQKIGYVMSPVVKSQSDLDSIPEVITQLVDKANIDMILVSKSRKSFFKRLFGSSVSKAMALDLHKPAFFSKTH